MQSASISGVTANNMTVSWLPPAFNGYSVITSYTVQLYNHLNVSLNDSCPSSLNNNKCVVTDTFARFIALTPFSIYYIHISASNAIGRSEIEILSIRTSEIGK